jgi:hypothetical protein
MPDSIVVVYLRRIDVKLDRVVMEVGDLKRRVTALDESRARLRHDIAELHPNYAGLQLRFDRVDERLDRIERRLDLQDVAH